MSFGSLQRERDPRAQRRRQARQLRARHRRRLDQPLPPRERRRPDLGDRLRLLRLPRRRRLVQRGALRRQRAPAAGQDDRAEAVAGRQARPRRRAAGAEGDARDRGGARRAPWVDCVSPASHSAFSTPIEMMHFIERLRELSGGKPTGFKLCIGHPWEWFAIAKAMLETGITPDFIVVDGAEGGTGAAPLEFTDHVGAPLQEGLLLVHNTLVGLNLREQDQARLRRQGRQRLRHRAHARARRRLVQRGARLHVRARLHPGADLPHRPLPDRRDDAGPAAREGARRADQGRAGLPLPPEHADGAEGAGAGGGPEAPERDRRRRTSCGAAPSTASSCWRTCCRSCKPGALLDGDLSQQVFRTYWPMAEREQLQSRSRRRFDRLARSAAARGSRGRAARTARSGCGGARVDEALARVQLVGEPRQVRVVARASRSPGSGTSR